MFIIVLSFKTLTAYDSGKVQFFPIFINDFVNNSQGNGHFDSGMRSNIFSNYIRKLRLDGQNLTARLIQVLYTIVLYLR